MFLSEDEVRKLLPMGELIPVTAKALSDLSSGKVIQPVRTVLPIADHGGFFGVMAAVRLCADAHPPSPSVGSGQLLNVGKYSGTVGAKLVTFIWRGDTRTHRAMILLFGPLESVSRSSRWTGGSCTEIA